MRFLIALCLLLSLQVASAADLSVQYQAHVDQVRRLIGPDNFTEPVPAADTELTLADIAGQYTYTMGGEEVTMAISATGVVSAEGEVDPSLSVAIDGHRVAFIEDDFAVLFLVKTAQGWVALTLDDPSGVAELTYTAPLN